MDAATTAFIKDVNIAFLGPCESGKTSFIRTYTRSGSLSPWNHYLHDDMVAKKAENSAAKVFRRLIFCQRRRKTRKHFTAAMDVGDSNLSSFIENEEEVMVVESNVREAILSIGKTAMASSFLSRDEEEEGKMENKNTNNIPEEKGDIVSHEEKNEEGVISAINVNCWDCAMLHNTLPEGISPVLSGVDIMVYVFSKKALRIEKEEDVPSLTLRSLFYWLKKVMLSKKSPAAGTIIGFVINDDDDDDDEKNEGKGREENNGKNYFATKVRQIECFLSDLVKGKKRRDAATATKESREEEEPVVVGAQEDTKVVIPCFNVQKDVAQVDCYLHELVVMMASSTAASTSTYSSDDKAKDCQQLVNKGDVSASSSYSTSTPFFLLHIESEDDKKTLQENLCPTMPILEHRPLYYSFNIEELETEEGGEEKNDAKQKEDSKEDGQQHTPTVDKKQQLQKQQPKPQRWNSMVQKCFRESLQKILHQFQIVEGTVGVFERSYFLNEAMRYGVNVIEKDVQQAEELFRLMSIYAFPGECTTLYNITCCLSLRGKVDEALEFFWRSLSSGYEDETQIIDDADLENLKAQRSEEVKILMTALRLKKKQQKQREGEQEEKERKMKKKKKEIDELWNTLQGRRDVVVADEEEQEKESGVGRKKNPQEEQKQCQGEAMKEKPDKTDSSENIPPQSKKKKSKPRLPMTSFARHFIFQQCSHCDLNLGNAKELFYPLDHGRFTVCRNSVLGGYEEEEEEERQKMEMQNNGNNGQQKETTEQGVNFTINSAASFNLPTTSSFSPPNTSNENNHLVSSATTSTSQPQKSSSVSSFLPSYGVLLKGFDNSTGQTVLIREFSLQRVLIEKSFHLPTIFQVSHKNIAQYFGTFLCPNSRLSVDALGQQAFTGERCSATVMEWLPSGNVGNIIKRYVKGPLQPSVVQKYLLHVVHGMEFLHLSCMTHRDIRPSKMLLTEEGVVKLGGFGPMLECFERPPEEKKWARQRELLFSKEQALYFAPEVAEDGQFSFSSDVWAWACSAYEMVTGKTIWEQHYRETTTVLKKNRCQQGGLQKKQSKGQQSENSNGDEEEEPCCSAWPNTVSSICAYILQHTTGPMRSENTKLANNFGHPTSPQHRQQLSTVKNAKGIAIPILEVEFPSVWFGFEEKECNVVGGDLSSLVKLCFAIDPKNRPSASEISAALGRHHVRYVRESQSPTIVEKGEEENLRRTDQQKTTSNKDMDTKEDVSGDDAMMVRTVSMLTDAEDRFISWNETLGKGAFGVVEKGYDTLQGDFVAIKKARNDSMNYTQSLQSIKADAELMVGLAHPNVVQVRYVQNPQEEGKEDSSGGGCGLVMEWLPSGSISDQMKQLSFRLHEMVALRYTKEALQGLMYLHACGIIHRDIKPANMLLTSRGKVKMADFGMSVGTMPYWAPEIAFNSCKSESFTMQSDIWAIACAICTMTSRQEPWSNLGPEIYGNKYALFYFLANIISPTSSSVEAEEGSKSTATSTSTVQKQDGGDEKEEQRKSDPKATNRPQQKHPSIPKHLSKGLHFILSQCFDLDPQKRPSAVELLRWISDHLQDIKKEVGGGGIMEPLDGEHSATKLSSLMKDGTTVPRWSKNTSSTRQLFQQLMPLSGNSSSSGCGKGEIDFCDVEPLDVYMTEWRAYPSNCSTSMISDPLTVTSGGTAFHRQFGNERKNKKTNDRYIEPRGDIDEEGCVSMETGAAFAENPHFMTQSSRSMMNVETLGLQWAMSREQQNFGGSVSSPDSHSSKCSSSSVKEEAAFVRQFQ